MPADPHSKWEERIELTSDCSRCVGASDVTRTFHCFLAPLWCPELSQASTHIRVNPEDYVAPRCKKNKKTTMEFSVFYTAVRLQNPLRTNTYMTHGDETDCVFPMANVVQENFVKKRMVFTLRKNPIVKFSGTRRHSICEKDCNKFEENCYQKHLRMSENCKDTNQKQNVWTSISKPIFHLGIYHCEPEPENPFHLRCRVPQDRTLKFEIRLGKSMIHQENRILKLEGRLRTLIGSPEICTLKSEVRLRTSMFVPEIRTSKSQI